MNFKANLVNQVVQQKEHVVRATRPINDEIDRLEKDLASSVLDSYSSGCKLHFLVPIGSFM